MPYFRSNAEVWSALIVMGYPFFQNVMQVDYRALFADADFGNAGTNLGIKAVLIHTQNSTRQWQTGVSAFNQ